MGVGMKKKKKSAVATAVAYLESPIGIIRVEAEGDQVTRIAYDDKTKLPKFPAPTGVLKVALKQLGEYFKGKRRDFEFKYRVAGTEFQCNVWEKLLEIPYARVVTYWDVDEVLGGNKAYRAVGSACGKNPLPILLPCHRVLASDGSLGGYTGGLDRKEWLLEHEADVLEGAA